MALREGMKTVTTSMSKEEQAEQLKALRKKREETERRLERIDNEIALWEAIRKGSSSQKIQAILNRYFRRDK